MDCRAQAFLLEWRCSCQGVESCPGPVALGMRLWWVGEEMRGLLWGRHCRGWQGIVRIPPPTVFLGAAASPCLPMSLLPGAVPAGSCFSVPRSPPSQCSQTPSHPLCAQLCPADPSWQQDTAQGHLCVCRGKRAAQVSANENRALRAFSRTQKEIPIPH